MRRHLIALFVVLFVVTLALAGCGPSQEPSTPISAAAVSTTASTLGTTTTQAPTTTMTMATTTTTMATTTTTEAATTTTEAAATTTTKQKLVKVPSYTDFKSSYQGNDFGKALKAWQAAVEAGFHKVGLVAKVEFLPPGEQDSQNPKAGQMVPKGTVVHIRVVVYD
jgi:hypothetical protein